MHNYNRITLIFSWKCGHQQIPWVPHLSILIFDILLLDKKIITPFSVKIYICTITIITQNCINIDSNFDINVGLALYRNCSPAHIR